MPLCYLVTKQLASPVIFHLAGLVIKFHSTTTSPDKVTGNDIPRLAPCGRLLLFPGVQLGSVSNIQLFVHSR